MGRGISGFDLLQVLLWHREERRTQIMPVAAVGAVANVVLALNQIFV